jgi:ATP-dependent helicase/nuclease subunit A
MNLKIVSAGAGSGKTYRLMSEMVDLLKSGTVQPEGIIATTFTKKAAAELEERVRVRLLEEGLPELADRLTGALIGTVHGLGVKLLKRFCFEAGVSPSVDIIADEDQNVFFNQSLATILTHERVEKMEILTEKLALRKIGMTESYDWRQDVKDIVDRARVNGFDVEKMEESREKSYQSLIQLFPEPSPQSKEHFDSKLKKLLQHSLEALEDNDADSTKVTTTAKTNIQRYITRIGKGDDLSWYDWVSISKIKTGAKSKGLVEELQDFARDHERHPDFLKDIKEFIDSIFDVAIKAIEEYEKFKKKRGLIDYIDMETQVKRLLDNSAVHEVLSAEIDLLMVDEFQDTSPIQLEIFWKLTQMANHSIWVGDPKQSIYGFRGAEPALMHAIIEKTGGIKPEDIQIFSWRSREELVYASNALFVKAFPDLPKERIALIPKRRATASDESSNNENEPIEMGTGLIHWHYEHEGGKKTPPGRPWMERCIARSIRHMIEKKQYINDEGDNYRPIRAGDIAVLCRSNRQCLEVASALHHQGMKASIARNGLLETPEAKLVLSCLKYLLNQHDSLSVAEITFLASSKPLEEIIDSRIQWMEERAKEDNAYLKWESDNIFIKRLDELRLEITELSGAEILNLILEDLDLRRIIIAWGNPEQRCDNVDMLRHFADKYEDACNRLHTGASLGGFLLWLNDLAANEKDAQGSSEQPDAVNVLTYHRSKGLEWPVVVMHSLENKLRDSIWGATVAADTDEVDLENLSANRYIRFWRHPYGRQFQKTNLQINLDNSETKKQAINKAVEEEARLMYVGITRARDYLVFTSRQKSMLWLNRTWNGLEGETQPTLDSKSFETPWEWKGQIMPIETDVELLPQLLEHHPRPTEHISSQQERAGKKDKGQPYFIQYDSDKSLYHEYKFKTGAQSLLGIAFKEVNDISPYIISKAVQSYLSFDLPTYTQGQKMAAAERILERYKINEEISYMELVSHANQFMSWVEKNLQPKNWYKHYPILLIKDKRRFDTNINLLIENDRFITVVQHSSFSGNHKKWKKQATDLSNWFYLVQLGLKTIFPNKEIRLFLHFVVQGGLQEVEVEVKDFQGVLNL